MFMVVERPWKKLDPVIGQDLAAVNSLSFTGLSFFSPSLFKSEEGEKGSFKKKKRSSAC